MRKQIGIIQNCLYNGCNSGRTNKKVAEEEMANIQSKRRGYYCAGTVLGDDTKSFSDWHAIFGYLVATS